MKKFISLLLCAALILTLAACGAEPEPTQPPTQPIQDVELEMDRDLRPYLGVELTMVSMASEDILHSTDDFGTENIVQLWNHNPHCFGSIGLQTAGNFIYFVM